MEENEERALNQAAFRRLSKSFGQKYGKGRFLAVSKGEVIADANSFQEIQASLKSMGKDPSRILIVQAGIEYPDKAVIF